ncbi:MAG: glucose-6-phosphate isomerase [Planctomycetota bacterium]|nr:MAG: glucose-6-phosphate isomerase [Planctomycetota bacterium]
MREVREEHTRQGLHAHLDLARIEREARSCFHRAHALRERFFTFVQCGIGGSALGNVAVHTALPGNRSVLVLDNLDPDSFPTFAQGLDRTFFHVVSKSGETLETLAQFLIVTEVLEGALGPRWREHIVVTTSRRDSALAQVCEQQGIEMLSLEPRLGGRFSYMSPVGLLSLAFAGRDPMALVRGARAAAERCLSERSPALAYALLLQRMLEAGRRIAVFWPYSERLWGLALWWRQLLAESLGKRCDLEGNEVRLGPCPYPALGASDQHSVHQLFMEGPDDKWFTFVELAHYQRRVRVPERYGEHPSFARIGGRELGEIMRAELRGTRHALEQAGRPCAALRLGRLDEETVGALLMTLECVITFAGKLLHVDPYDQPGVEAGKRATRALLEREGEAVTEAQRILSALAPDPGWVFAAGAEPQPPAGAGGAEAESGQAAGRD